MDTREKIVPLDKVGALIEKETWVAVAGLFDPLTAVQAARLARLAPDGDHLLAIVLEGENTLLPVDARAALVAGLREVHLVAIAAAEVWRAAIPKEADIQIVEDAEGDRARTAEFVQFILDRQRLEASRPIQSQS